MQYPNNEFNYSVFFPSLNTGYCGGTSGYTFKTTNGGFNWYEQVITGGAFRRDFNFVNDTVGWVVGGGGHIFKTTTGGQFVGIEPVSSIIPGKFNLYQNYPNPFNNQTIFEFDISENENYQFEIFDVLGRKIRVLFNENMKKGRYKLTFNGDNLSSGIYICRLVTKKIQVSKTMVLIK
ncbi:MAG: T9SS type A sorting domain-containing protein [Chlorobi bacterium]|nr:T9SS type A sorting domain-containing protein [Chlorobiota bacterium]